MHEKTFLSLREHPSGVCGGEMKFKKIIAKISDTAWLIPEWILGNLLAWMFRMERKICGDEAEKERVRKILSRDYSPTSKTMDDLVELAKNNPAAYEEKMKRLDERLRELNKQAKE
jgi:hypothetical protein